MARLFFAVGVSSDVGSALGSLCSNLRKTPAADCLRFIEVGQAHYTLRFLGEVGAERQRAALRAGHAAAAGAHGFDVAARSLGVFPDERRPHTLWIGAGAGASELVALTARLGTRLEHEGFSLEERPFVPHLTLARVKRRPPPGAVRALLSEPHEAFGPWRVESFALMESRSTSNGVRYIALETFPLEVP